MATSGAARGGSAKAGPRYSWVTSACAATFSPSSASVAQASQAIHATDDYVHAHPWRAVGIVAGVGALAGLVTGLMVNRRGHANGATNVR